MTITEAAREAAKTRSCISREDWKGLNMAILPTNGTECCMLVRTKKNEGQYLVGPLWEPQRNPMEKKRHHGMHGGKGRRRTHGRKGEYKGTGKDH